MRFSLVVLAAAAGVPGSSAAQPSQAESSLATRLDAVVQGAAAEGFTGAVLVARGGDIILDAGYGSVRGVAVTGAARFWIASAGKQFTSAAVLRCAERAWLRLTDSLARFIPDAPADKSDITVKQLLAHLSGLAQSYVSEGQTTRADAVRRMLAEPLAQPPGRGFGYSNNNYQLAAAIVEIVSGAEYRDFVTREFFRPLGLTDTGFNATPGADSVLPAQGDLPPRLRQPSWGAEGYYSTTRDLFRWYRFLRTGQILSPASVRELFAPQTPIGEGQAALGWFIGKGSGGVDRIFTRGNEDWGPNSLLYSYPSLDLTIVILTHAGDSPDGQSWSRSLLARLEMVALSPPH